MAHTKGMKLITMVLMAGLLSLTACGKKDSGATRVTGSRGSGAVGGSPTTGSGGTPTSLGSTCKNGQSAVGKIYLTIGQESNFRPQVTSFLSATLQDQYIGNISGNRDAPTGIDFEAKFKFEDSGVIRADQTQVLISVFDSYVNTPDPQTQQLIQAYRIFFGKASAGQYNNNGSYTVQFKDEYGEVSFTGNYSSGEYTSGVVSYVNYSNINGGQATSGQLGYFQIRTCGIFY